MSSFGLDYVTGPPVDQLQAAGVTFVCRYLSFVNSLTQVKLLTSDEAQALGAAGIAIVSNYEWYANRALEGFASGVQDAQIAASQHAACGGPPDRPIYFSVDADVDGSAVAAYFKGVASVIGLSRTGAYGSYRVLEYLFNVGDIAWGWQTYAWSGGAWEPRAHIQQYQNGVTMSGQSVDYDRSLQADFGQWLRGGVMVPDGWHDANNILTAPNGVIVVKGFRDYVLSHNWDGGNWPLAAEQGVGLLEASNPSLGGGTQQVFRWSMLGYTQERGVFMEWIGQELITVRQQAITYHDLSKQLQTEVDSLKAQLQAAQQPTGVDPAHVASYQSQVAVQAKQIDQLAQQLQQGAAQPIS